MRQILSGRQSIQYINKAKLKVYFSYLSTSYRSGYLKFKILMLFRASGVFPYIESGPQPNFL